MPWGPVCRAWHSHVMLIFIFLPKSPASLEHRISHMRLQASSHPDGKRHLEHDRLLLLCSPVLQQSLPRLVLGLPSAHFFPRHPTSSGLESHIGVCHHIWQLPCVLNTKCIYNAPGLRESFPLRTCFDQDVSM